MTNPKLLMYPPCKGYTFAPFDDMDRGFAEDSLGIVLPSALIKLLKVQNGGLLRFNTHASPMPSYWADDHVPVESLRGLCLNDDNSLNATGEIVEEWGLEADLVPISGSSMGCVCLDYREIPGDGEPSVIWFEGADGTDFELAPDFASFLAGLKRGERKHVISLPAGISVEAAFEAVSSALGEDFKVPEDEADEEPDLGMIGTVAGTHSLTDPAVPAELWLISNTKPNGWVEFPEAPGDALLLGIDIARAEFEPLWDRLKAAFEAEPVILHRPWWG